MEDNKEVTSTDVNTDAKELTPVEKTFTQKEFDSAISKMYSKLETKFNKQISLSQLDDNERAKVEADDKIAELEAQLKEFNQLKMKQEVNQVLSSRKLPLEFADLVPLEGDVEQVKAKIDSLDKLFRDAVKVEVEARIGTTTPKSSTTIDASITKEQFKNMGLAEQAKIFESNPELYKALTQR